MEKRTLAQIEQEIAETKAALKDVHGTETEVYARIVGYYRAVKHWNKGKRDEYDQRKMFTLEASKNKDYEISIADSIESPASVKVTAESTPVTDSECITYELYTRKTCPNCPPVKNFMKDMEMPGRTVDVDTKEGLAEAAKNGVFATPTVIFYNNAGIETARCHNVEELEAVFSKIPVTA